MAETRFISEDFTQRTKAFLTNKWGPMPAWAWLTIGAIAVYVWRTRYGGGAVGREVVQPDPYTGDFSEMPAVVDTGPAPSYEIPGGPLPPSTEGPAERERDRRGRRGKGEGARRDRKRDRRRDRHHEEGEREKRKRREHGGRTRPPEGAPDVPPRRRRRHEGDRQRGLPDLPGLPGDARFRPWPGYKGWPDNDDLRRPRPKPGGIQKRVLPKLPDRTDRRKDRPRGDDRPHRSKPREQAVAPERRDPVAAQQTASPMRSDTSQVPPRVFIPERGNPALSPMPISRPFAPIAAAPIIRMPAPVTAPVAIPPRGSGRVEVALPGGGIYVGGAKGAVKVIEQRQAQQGGGGKKGRR